MERHKLSAEQAFDWLLHISNNSNRKLVDVARELVETGTTEGLPRPGSR